MSAKNLIKQLLQKDGRKRICA